MKKIAVMTDSNSGITQEQAKEQSQKQGKEQSQDKDGFMKASGEPLPFR